MYMAYWCIAVTVVVLWYLCQLWIALAPWAMWTTTPGYVASQA